MSVKTIPSKWATTGNLRTTGLVCKQCHCTFDWTTPGPISSENYPQNPSFCGGDSCQRGSEGRARRALTDFDALLSGKLTLEQYRSLGSIGGGPLLPASESPLGPVDQANHIWEILVAHREAYPPRYWLLVLKAGCRGIIRGINVGFYTYILARFLLWIFA